MVKRAQAKSFEATVNDNETEQEEKKTYTVLQNKTFIDGQQYQEGDTVELTPTYARQLTDKDVRLSLVED